MSGLLWLHAEVSATKENLMSEQERQRIDQYIQCTLCGVCYASCPALRSNADFAGPAALAKLNRFLADSRDGGRPMCCAAGRLGSGRLGCRKRLMSCVRACPKTFSAQ